MGSNLNNHSKQEQSETDLKFESVKAEFGLEDEDIRRINDMQYRFQQIAMQIIGSEEEKKIIFLINQLKQRDKIRILEIKKEIKETMTDMKINFRSKKKYKEYSSIIKHSSDDVRKMEFIKKYLFNIKRNHGYRYDKGPLPLQNLLSFVDQGESETPLFKLLFEDAIRFPNEDTNQLEIKEIFESRGEEWIREFSDLYKNISIKQVMRMSSIYKRDIKKFKEFKKTIAEIAKAQGCHAVNALSKAHSVYGKNKVMFNQFAEVAKAQGANAVYALANAHSVYGKNKVMFNQFAKVAKTRGRDAVNALSKGHSVYGENKVMFNMFAEIAKAQGCRTVYALSNAPSVYRKNQEMFKEFKKIIAEIVETMGSSGVEVFSDAHIVYGDDKEMFNTFAEVVKTQRWYVIKILRDAHIVYGKDKEMFNQFAEVVKTRDEHVVKALRDAHIVYGKDKGMFNIFVEIIKKEDGLHILDALVELKNLHQNDLDKLRTLEPIISDITSHLGKDVIKTLVDYKGLYGNDVTKLQKAAKYAETTKIFDKTVLTKYIGIFEQEGEEKANEYLESLSSKAKVLIGSKIPEGHRELPEYQYLVRYVFPDGNNSTYEDNLGCGDKLEHVKKYKFDREGYPVVLTGLLGYKVKEGVEPDQQVLSAYTERLGKIRQFITSRGPDNEALQKLFEEKISKIFEEKAWSEFRKITSLSLKEKMLCLFLGEAVRRKQKGESSEPDTDICDLIIEYKYAFHEDLEAYVARSADGVKAYKDKVNQDYMLLAELSAIYGENVKHVLRHNIFEELENSENYDQVIEVFSEKLGGTSESKNLTSKQWKRIDNTFANDRIPTKKRSKILYKQVYGLFSSNIEFESDEERQEFVDKLKDIFAKLENDLTVQKFRELLPKFYKLRALYRSGINTQLTELFTYDINTIFEELAKYEENVEIEEVKERRTGNVKEIKKSSKKRNVRGYFTKTAETANARMGAYLCIAGDTKMWENKNYFEMILVDEKTNKCVGVVMLLEVKGKDGEKYLWFGPNPFKSFLDVVSGQACYQFLYKKTCEFAEQNNFAGVVVPSEDDQILGECTNRIGDFPGFIKASRLRDKKDGLITVDFDKRHTLGESYGYTDGALIWKKGKNVKHSN
jgi:hypothetical protein